MSLLQEAPLDVHPSVYCGPNGSTREHAMYDSTRMLLDRTQSLRPYAGLIIRHAASQSEIEKLQKLHASRAYDDPLPPSSYEHLRFYNPVQTALEDWGENEPLGSNVWFTPLKLERFATTKTVPPHIDPRFEAGSPMPKAGPVTALLLLQGAMKYRLSVARIDIFEPATRSKLEGSWMPSPMRTHEVIQKPGDLLLYANVQPTRHEGESLDGNRLSALFTTEIHTTLEASEVK